MRDLQRIEEYVRNGLDRSRVRGVAIFACDADGLWEVVELPVPVLYDLPLSTWGNLPAAPLGPAVVRSAPVRRPRRLDADGELHRG